MSKHRTKLNETFQKLSESLYRTVMTPAEQELIGDRLHSLHVAISEVP